MIAATLGLPAAVAPLLSELNRTIRKGKGELPRYPPASVLPRLLAALGLTEPDGRGGVHLANLDGSPSPVVHQYDRLGTGAYGVIRRLRWLDAIRTC